MKRTPEHEARVAAALRDYRAGVRIADIQQKYRMSLSELNNARRRAGLPSQAAMRETWGWLRAKANMALTTEK